MRWHHGRPDARVCCEYRSLRQEAPVLVATFCKHAHAVCLHATRIGDSQPDPIPQMWPRGSGNAVDDVDHTRDVGALQEPKRAATASHTGSPWLIWGTIN